MTDPHLQPVDLGDGIAAAFTCGWAPGARGEGFNLSMDLGDRPEAVEARLRIVEDWLGAPVVRARQVHGAGVHLCRDAAGSATADALVATGRELGVAVLVADCVPVLLADAGVGVVAAVHAGRGGVVAGVVGAAVAAMAAQGARLDQVQAVIGPAICGSCYEVPGALRSEVARGVPATASTTSWGTPALDLPAGVRAQLEAAGVRQVRSPGPCTLEDDRYFSHRATASGRPAGRFAAVIRATR